jgi:glycosyltransferase involved in cell wall biosynthesis
LKNNEDKKTIAIIPCYNEEHTIGSIILKAKRHVNEVLVIDDGSTDETSKVAKEAGARVIVLPAN